MNSNLRLPLSAVTNYTTPWDTTQAVTKALASAVGVVARWRLDEAVSIAARHRSTPKRGWLIGFQMEGAGATREHR